MSKKRLLTLMGGSKNVLPISIDFTVLSDGSLPNSLTGKSWAIASGRAVNTPLLSDELITNGNMETGDPPTDWTTANSTPAAAADERTGGAGSKSLSLTNIGSVYGVARQGMTLPGGAWVLVDGYVKRITCTFSQLLLQKATTFETLAYRLSTSTNWTNLQFTNWTSGDDCVITTGNSNTNNGENLYDDISVKQLTTTSLYAYSRTKYSSVTASTIISTSPAGKHAGIILNIDNPENPLNYIIAYLGESAVGALQTRLDKCVNGVFTNVIAANATFGATKNLKVIKDGDNYSLYYGTVGSEVQVGTTQVVANMNGKTHGLFSTAPGATFNTFSLEATPSGF